MVFVFYISVRREPVNAGEVVCPGLGTAITVTMFTDVGFVLLCRSCVINVGQ